MEEKKPAAKSALPSQLLLEEHEHEHEQEYQRIQANDRLIGASPPSSLREASMNLVVGEEAIPTLSLNNNNEELSADPVPPPPAASATPVILPPSPVATLRDEDSAASSSLHLTSSRLVPPLLPERTLKEKLVERERQKRIETERARLKRLFALSHGGGGVEEQLLEEDGSAGGGTVGGGSSVAAVLEHENEEEAAERLGYAMERFLLERESAVANGHDQGNPHLTSGIGTPGMPSAPLSTEPESVVMERFLAQPIVVDPPTNTLPTPPSVAHDVSSNNVDLSQQVVSSEPPFDQANEPDDLLEASHHDSSVLETAAGSHADEDSDRRRLHHHHRDFLPDPPLVPLDSMEEPPVQMVDELEIQLTAMTSSIGNASSHRAPDSPSFAQASSVSSQASEPRVFRLTEREIQEMAAIEEASIGNAPPSEQDISEVADLVQDLGAFSERTHTTASVTSVGGNHSNRNQGDGDDHSIDGIATASVSSHLVLSPGASNEGSVSVTANPPSVIANEETSSVHDVILQPGTPIPPIAVMPHMVNDSDEPLDASASAAANSNVVNRQIRPGMVPTPPRSNALLEAPGSSSSMKRVFSMPEKMHITIDGFDYDKFDQVPITPRLSDGAENIWSPDALLFVSPLQDSNRKPAARPTPGNPPSLSINYGAVVDPTGPPLALSETNRQHFDSMRSDTDPLIPVPSRNIREKSRGSSMRTVAESIFSSIRSDGTASIEEDANEAENYKSSNVLKRAFPERFIALFVTLLVEIPVLLMVSGGSDRLCMLIGRKRYQLMMGFLPLSSAISGNCGLQASTLTTRAISHQHVTVSNFLQWFRKEVGAALFLGLGMGAVLGSYAFVVSGLDVPFGLTIFIAQFISIVTAGVTGTFAPLVFTFIFHRDSGKWGGPLETAIQDIVGSFAMVVLSYRMLVIFGPTAVDPSDVCGA